MSEAQDLKLFISWSGKLSRGVALALRSWMPLIFDRVKPWTSETDIEPGQRGLAEIEAKLAGTKFGLVVVTQENQHAPWLNFEAGALSKVVPDDSEEARVVPLLVDMTTPTQVTGPIAQFQARVLNEQGIIDVAKSIGRVAGVDPNTAEDRCKTYWPKLDEKIKKVQAELDETPRQAPRPPNEMIEEILGLVRTIRSDMLASSVRQRGIRDDTSIGVAKVLNHTLGKMHIRAVETSIVETGDGPAITVVTNGGSDSQLQEVARALESTTGATATVYRGHISARVGD